ncbi:MAG TPA: RagB/SusD family nutrient uptake outer membrane protein [Chitinophagaceae bacterium]|nr:RagB/SusD family nutrient uptake outer membrane protein [Chitinophagaceae bacterium]
MRSLIIKTSITGALLTSIVLGTGCKKNFADPSRPTEDQVFNSPKGLTGVAVGLQRVYTAGRASSLYNLVAMDAFVTNQATIVNQGNTAEYQLFLGGGQVDGTNTILAGLWTSSNKIIYDADLVISNAETLGDKPYASGLVGYATVFKALALGNLATFWEKVPEGNGENVGFVSRQDGYVKAIAAIDKALGMISANGISPAFLSNIPAGIDITNSLNALKARYSLFAGNYAQALTAANAVDLTKKSTLNFDATNLNPIFETVTSTNNVYAITDSVMGLPVAFQPELTDKRLPFYISTNATAPRFRVNGFGAATTTPWPVYLPGEIILIKAEVYARQNQLPQALTELNKVVTKKPADDPFGVGADMPALVGPFTQQELLDQIYKQRRIELFMSGLSLEDMRRFGRPNAERKRNFFPYPFRERDNNPNTPPDPAF